jgi:hypothetical protein
MKFSATVILALTGLALHAAAAGRALKSRKGKDTEQQWNECVLSPSVCTASPSGCDCSVSPISPQRRETFSEENLFSLIEEEEREELMKSSLDQLKKLKEQTPAGPAGTAGHVQAVVKSLFSKERGERIMSSLGQLKTPAGPAERVQAVVESLSSEEFKELMKSSFSQLKKQKEQTPAGRAGRVQAAESLLSSMEEEEEAWAHPSKEATLLAANPGIWTVDSFLTEEQSDRLLAIIKKNGYEKGMFGPCTDESLMKKGHPHYETTNKLCFKMSSETLYNELFFKKSQIIDKDVNKGYIRDKGDCGEAPCSAETDPEDGIFLDSIFSKIKALWETDVNPRPHVSVVLSTGTSTPLRVHDDSGILLSSVLYLTDGGASTIFPNAGVTIEPKKGKLATWLNMRKDGVRMNRTAKHGVQAHPGSAGERATVNIFIRDLSPKEFVAAQEDHRRSLLESDTTI